MILISVSVSKVISRPVGNSPGPDSIVSVTGGELLMGFPPASQTVTMIWQSSVALVPRIVVLSALSRKRLGIPCAGGAEGTRPKLRLRYQCQLCLGRSA